jgi:hypothetical protein
MNTRPSSKRLLKQVLPALLAAAVLASPAAAQVLVSLDFETASQVTNNFRTGTSTASALAQTSNGAANDYLTVTNNLAGTNGLRSLVYDTTPASSAVQNTFSGSSIIEGDIDTSKAGQSFGVYIVNPSVEGTSNFNLLALFNWDASGTNDQVRFFRNSSFTAAGTGTSAYNSGTTISAGVNAADGFAPFSLTYSQDTSDTTQAILNMTVGTFNTGNILMGTGTYLSSYEIGFRFGTSNAVGDQVALDNISVTQVPEPSAAALAVTGLLGLAWLRRKRLSA